MRSAIETSTDGVEAVIRAAGGKPAGLRRRVGRRPRRHGGGSPTSSRHGAAATGGLIVERTCSKGHGFRRAAPWAPRRTTTTTPPVGGWVSVRRSRRRRSSFVRPGEDADDWRWRLARELACLLRRPTPEARVPPYLAELRSAGLAANAHGVGSPEHVAASRLVFAAAASRVSAWRTASTYAGVESAESARVPSSTSSRRLVRRLRRDRVRRRDGEPARARPTG